MGARAAEAAAPLPSMQHLPGIAALAASFFLVLAKWFLPPYFPRSFTFDSQVKDEARGASPARLIFHARPTFLPGIRARRSRKHSGARRQAAARRCRRRFWERSFSPPAVPGARTCRTEAAGNHLFSACRTLFAYTADDFLRIRAFTETPAR